MTAMCSAPGCLTLLTWRNQRQAFARVASRLGVKAARELAPRCGKRVAKAIRGEARPSVPPAASPTLRGKRYCKKQGATAGPPIAEYLDC